MTRRSDKSLGARLVLYWVVILGGMAMASFALNQGDPVTAAIGAAIALAMGVGELKMIAAVERSARPRKS